ncbi:TetR/AcrR family transcriptional regulator [Paenibacillus crassostreae]|uniref:HTH tetR-type domain-containing protein n=1 Tax=Paenibacillus crassostreae TaxID=1763538 RepID=A0A162KR98_9BACL|nr:TetR/AcrR family transcriptional regulator [Paenibacillus crassostreae]AOZ93184.1 hypothetical protein LPB68_13830 [Paenibacillus crassostreae]OAB71725.1 hypothetical protein PNBC_17060 [Paenibacillus crassostreae]
MSEKQTDKKTTILKTALQLFSTKGIASTSMQEIAEVCEMSKGSLYLHFKSKEELEESIYSYCFQLIRESVIRFEQESHLTPKEQLEAQLEALLHHLLELREFLKYQFMDGAYLTKKNGTGNCLQDDHFKMLNWFRLKLESIYGTEIEPYAMDLVFFFGGLLGSNLRMLFIPGLPLHTKKMSSHLISLLDDIAASMIARTPEPLIPTELWYPWIDEFQEQSSIQRHPFLITKEMKDCLKSITIDQQVYKDAFESIHILEKEIVDSHPRRVMIQGMIGNLEQIPELQALNSELREIISLYSMNV